MGNISSSKLTKLCAWPSDTDITSTVKFSYKLAFELAKALDMKPTTNTNNSLLQPFVIIEEQNLEISTGINKSSSEFGNDPNEFFEIDREISDAISQASKHAIETVDDILDLSNIENIDDQIQTQIISTLNNTRILYNEQLTHGIIIIFFYTFIETFNNTLLSINIILKDSTIRYIFQTEELNYLVMIALRKHHETYNSRPIERQNRAYIIGYEKENTINPNKASHIISHLTNNDDPEIRFVK
ncbi:hypothetical protein RhiirC2_709101 [Rhizophagus irregularis]|uniref:Uncharacterized protein n=1 Tax=Rhizophagus irregularis TaxID=588596 RepID=A0A2N1NK19_9GLOM|nr:hypothetical protein RhiirC2_709101 [Rhizophagus irregularis]